MPKNPREGTGVRVTHEPGLGPFPLFASSHHSSFLRGFICCPRYLGQPFLPQSSSSEQMFVHFSGLSKPQPHLYQEARSDCSHLLHHPHRLSLGPGTTCLLVYMRAHSTRAGTSLHPPAPNPVQDTEQKIFVD